MHIKDFMMISPPVEGAGSVVSLSVFKKDVKLGELASSSLEHTQTHKTILTKSLNGLKQFLHASALT